MSSNNLLMSPMDLQLPPTPPMDLSDSNSNSCNDFQVSFIHEVVQSGQIASPLLSHLWFESRTSWCNRVWSQCWVSWISRLWKKNSYLPSAHKTHFEPIAKKTFHVRAVQGRAAMKNKLIPCDIKSPHQELTRCLQKRNHANETAHKYRAVSLASTSIHSEHASISCCSRERLCFDFELLHDVHRFIFIKRRREKRNEEKTLYTPIECGFLVAFVFVGLLVDSVECRVTVFFAMRCNTISRRVFLNGLTIAWWNLLPANFMHIYGGVSSYKKLCNKTFPSSYKKVFHFHSKRKFKFNFWVNLAAIFCRLAGTYLFSYEALRRENENKQTKSYL